MDHKWRRVQSTPIPKDEQRRIDRNRGIQKNDIFKQACKAVGVMPTKRQASKWNNKKGMAYKGRRAHV